MEYGTYQLDGSQDQRMCIISSKRLTKRENKAFKYYIRKEKRWLGHILRVESLVKEVIRWRIEGKRGK